MAEYIKKSDAIEVLEFYESIGAYHDYRLKDSMQSIKPADVAEVVRCKDCKHRIDDKEFQCGHICLKRRANGGRFCEDNDYCSYGERREP